MSRYTAAAPGHAALAVLVTGLLASGVATAQPGEGDPVARPAPVSQRIPRHPSLLEFPPRVVRIPAPEPFVHRLAGGIRVVVVEDDALPLVRISVVLPAHPGPVGDNPAVPPLAAAMMRRGGTALHTPADLDAAADYLGADMDVASGVDRSVARLDCLASTLGEASDLFFEMLRDPAFDEARFEQLRGNLLASFAARNDDPIDVMERELAWLLFGRRSPRAVQLTAPDLEALARDDLARYQRRAWRPDGAVIAVSGAVATGEVLRSLEAQLGKWRQSEGEVAPQAQAEAPRMPAPAEPEPGLYWAAHPSSQAKVSLALRLDPLPGWDPGRAAAADLVNEILGGTGLLSRLGGRLRGGGGLVYRVLSEVERQPSDPGLFRVFLDTGSESLPAALAGTVDEIERLRRDPVPAGELEAVRQELLSRLARRFDTAEEIAGYFAEDILVDRPHSWWSDYLAALRALTPGDVRRTARELIDPAELIVVVVGGPTTADELRGLRVKERLVRHWFEEAHVLPPRDPLTLEPISEVSATAPSR